MNEYKVVENLLRSYKDIEVDLSGVNIELKLEGVRGISYENENFNPNINTSSPVEVQAIVREKLNKEKLELELKKELIGNMLNLLSEEEMIIVDLRYFKELEWNIIAMRMNMSKETAQNRRKSILGKKLIPYCKKYRLI